MALRDFILSFAGTCTTRGGTPLKRLKTAYKMGVFLPIFYHIFTGILWETKNLRKK